MAGDENSAKLINTWVQKAPMAPLVNNLYSWAAKCVAEYTVWAAVS